ncbi:MAG: hypothetical protein HY664_07380 [Chloroflexi bacterium]|nr:hypothetical protein [Chloroflexota bacterium]
MKSKIAWGALIGVLFFALGCQKTEETPIPSATPEASALLARAGQGLEAASSYRFTISATYYWTFEGKEQVWTFTGEGAAAKPDKFRSLMEGTADTTLGIELVGGTIKAWDSRGDIANPSTTFGGPGVGAAPYTVIAYFKNPDQSMYLGEATVDNLHTHHLSFIPQLARVAQLDTYHANDLKRVTSVKGEVWIDETEARPRRISVEVTSLASDGSAQRVIITLDFVDFNKPVGF